VIFDTDILIFIQRGNKKAAALVESVSERHISVQTYLELLQGAQSSRQHIIIKTFLKETNFCIIQFTESIGTRACVYIEEYALSHGLGAGDAIVAATAVELGLELASSNVKHFKAIKELRLRPFRP